jgi:dTMP kinase
VASSPDRSVPPRPGGERRGLFLVFEGVEGAGKTTQVERLLDWLRKEGFPAVHAREPGGTPLGEAVREILLERVELEIGSETELLLMLAARAAFVRDLVRPALERGEIMVADRFEYSTFAYQGFGRGLPLEEVRRLNAFATGDLKPDLVIVLDLPAAEGRGRQAKSGKIEDRIEAAGSGFLETVAEGYRTLARDDDRSVLIDARSPPDRVPEVIRDLLIERFPEPFASGRGSRNSDLLQPGTDPA